MRNSLIAGGAACLVWLVACAAQPESAPVPAPATPRTTPATPSPAMSPVELRVMVKLAQAESDPNAIAAQVAAAAGTRARYVSAASPQWHALALVCASATECDAAMQRLIGNKASFEAVQRDERKRIVAP